MDRERLEAVVFLAAAAALGFQALAASRLKRAMRTKWRRLAGVIAEARPTTIEGDDGPTHLLQLTVDTAEGRKQPRDLIAQSSDELDDIAREYAAGREVTLLIDPKLGFLWVEGRTPPTFAGQLWGVTLALATIGASLWFGYLDPLLRYLGFPRH